jgi:hypothetical protein
MRVAASLITLLLVSAVVSAKKKKQKKENLFSSERLKCLVCKSLVEELEAAIAKVDPKKKIETGTFRLDGAGSQTKTLIPYARSQQHLMELVDAVCKNFEDYAQAKTKSSGEPVIIRIVTHEGNMNPVMSQVDMVPDDDLNTRLKFYCENIVEDQEDTIMELFAKENMDNLDIEFCSKRSQICEDMTLPPEEYDFEKKEL